MKIAIPKIRFTKSRVSHKYYKCHRCGYIHKDKQNCPICRKDGV